MDNSKLDRLIAIETSNLDKLTLKRDALDAKIKTSKGKIEQYNLLKNSQQFIVLSDALTNAGVGFDDILAAVSAGDFTSLQDKIINVRSSPDLVVSAENNS